MAQLGDSSEEAFKDMNSSKEPMPYHVWKALFNLGKKCIAEKKKNRPTSKEVDFTLLSVFDFGYIRYVHTGNASKCTYILIVLLSTYNQRQKTWLWWCSGLQRRVVIQLVVFIVIITVLCYN